MKFCCNTGLGRAVIPAFCFLIILATCTISGAAVVSETVKNEIKHRFPGSKIKETRDDMWNGSSVTEVEIVTKEGAVYELVISKDDQILNIEEEKELPLIGGELSLGAAVYAEREIYKGMDTEIQPVPYLSYENGPFEIQTRDGLEISYSFFKGESYSISLIGEYSFGGGYDTEDSIYLRGMDEPDSTYSIGLEGEMMLGDFEAGVDVLYDISGEESGQEAGFSITYPWQIAGFELRPGLNISWLSKKRVDYLYGVSEREATANRPAYHPDSGLEIGAELMILRPFLDKYTLVGLIEVSKPGGEITDSPIVDEDIEVSAAIGVMYRF